jgi:hypothetical protein
MVALRIYIPLLRGEVAWYQARRGLTYHGVAATYGINSAAFENTMSFWLVPLDNTDVILISSVFVTISAG